jgi:hypothetical protein
VAGKRVLAALLWEAATTGKATMPEGTELQLAPNDWLAIVKMLYSQIDGPPPQSIDLTSLGQRITGYASVNPDDWDGDASESAA